MIGRIKGTILQKKAPQLLLDVAGVGYEIFLPLSIFYKLPEVGAETILYTHLVIREDEHLLFGFLIEQERNLFRELIKVTNIGPKTALSILSSATPELFCGYVISDNVMALERLPGIGKKTAQRLIIELRDKLLNFSLGSSEQSAVGEKIETSISSASHLQDAISALVALGYKLEIARRAVFKVKNENLDSAELIRLALKEL